MARRLKNLTDVRRFLANLINRTESGEVKPELASKLGFLANSLARLIEGTEVEKRIEKIEKTIEERRKC